MRTKTKLKALAFMIPTLLFGSVGAGKVWEAATAAQKAAQARELQARFETSFAATKLSNTTRFARATYIPEETLESAEEVVPVVQKPQQLVIQNESDFSSVKIDEGERLFLANAIYGEARDEKKEGQIAVGLVILARVRDHKPEFGYSVQEVTLKYQKLASRWQFDGMKTTPTEKLEWIKSMQLAEAILRGEYSFSSVMRDVRYFYAVSPKAYKHRNGRGKSWLVRCTTVVATIGGHHFSKENNRCNDKSTLVVAHVHKPQRKVKVAAR